MVVSSEDAYEYHDLSGEEQAHARRQTRDSLRCVTAKVSGLSNHVTPSQCHHKRYQAQS